MVSNHKTNSKNARILHNHLNHISCIPKTYSTTRHSAFALTSSMTKGVALLKLFLFFPSFYSFKKFFHLL